MRIVAFAIFAVALLAGCANPLGVEPPQSVTLSETPAPAPVYTLALRVSEERPDGPGLKGALVQLGTLDAAGKIVGSPMQRIADADGWVRVEWREPVRLAVQAVAENKAAWTVEGVRLDVGASVVADRPLVVSERDVFLPLYRTELTYDLSTTWSTMTAELGENGMLNPVHTGVAIEFPANLQAAYLERLAKARVTLAWEETATSHADLAAGLAWDGALWVSGESSGPGLVPGERKAEYSAELPAQGRPADFAAAKLQAIAVTRTAVVGDVPIGIEVSLSFGDVRPIELPDPRCHSRNGCIIPLG